MAMDIQSPQMENQVSSEPMSLFDFLSREGSSITILPRINVSGSSPAGRVPAMPPPPSPPAKRFLSVSLPSSPRPAASLLVGKNRSGRNQVSLPAAAAREPKQQHHVYIGRSKSCGEGRASPPSIEYEVCLKRVDAVDHHGSSRNYEASFMKNAEPAADRITGAVHKGREGFKCAGALCLYLPAFIKPGKPGKPLTKKEAVDIQSIISRTMSLEKFECGSWSAAAIVTENTAEDHHCSEEDYDHGPSVDRQSINLFYELPLEMMQTGKVGLPRELFEKRELKGILTNSHLKAGEGRKSNHDPSRHVRFSTETPTLIPSSPTSCITPRLRQAREEFAAFLEAQNA